MSTLYSLFLLLYADGFCLFACLHLCRRINPDRVKRLLYCRELRCIIHAVQRDAAALRQNVVRFGTPQLHQSTAQTVQRARVRTVQCSVWVLDNPTISCCSTNTNGRQEWGRVRREKIRFSVVRSVCISYSKTTQVTPAIMFPFKL